MNGPIEGQQTRDVEILAIRRGWQAGLTLSQSFRCANKRHGMTDKAKAIAEWRKMKRLFGCGSARLDYVNGRRYFPPKPPSEAELNAPISNMFGGQTYGEWKGLTGPGKQLKELCAQE